MLISYGLLRFTARLVYAKINQWQHRSICWQQAGHVELCVVLIKTPSQVR